MPPLYDEALRRAIQLHNDDTWATLNFSPCLVRLLDDEHCRMISDILRDVGSAWEVRTAQPDLYQQLPMGPGLYMFVWHPALQLMGAYEATARSFPWILYIGQAGGGSSNNTLRDRYKNEYSKLLNGDPGKLFASNAPVNRSDRMKRYLRLRPLEYWWTEIADQQKIPLLEKRLVNLLQPPLNSQHRAGRLPVRKGKSINAFRET